MPLPGGHADKVGNRYELRWTVLQLIKLLKGDVDSIRLEPVGVEGRGVEFWVARDGVRSYHQVKRQNSSRGVWTIQVLDRLHVLSAVKSKLLGKQANFTFVSIESVKDLRELCERAASSMSATEFQEEYLTSIDLKAASDRLMEIWGVSVAELYDLLRRLSIEVISEDILQDQIEAHLSSVVEADPRAAYDILSSYVLDMVGRELTSSEVWDYLATLGIGPRDWLQNASVVKAAADTVTRYLSSAQAFPIGGTPILREEALEVASCLTGDDSRLSFVSGTAGVGKSGVVAQVVNKMRDESWPIIAFRLDRLPDCSTPKQVGEGIGLPGDPVEVLDVLARRGKCLLVIDQLDAVSQVSGRNSNVFDCVRDIVQKAMQFPQMRVLVACRTFDLENDHRFRQWSRELKPMKVEVQPLSQEAVHSVLNRLGYASDQMGKSAIEVLRVPLHLGMYTDVVTPVEGSPPSFNSTAQLFDEYWCRKRVVVDGKLDNSVWVTILDVACDYMSTHATLSIPGSQLDNLNSVSVNLMTSENVLVRDGYQYAFFHESFFDYVFARRFDAKGGDVVDLLHREGQQLFRRAQVRQILTFQRERRFDRYVETLQRLLFDTSIRLHIKQVVMAWLSTLDDPRQQEWEILKPLILDEKDPFGWGVWRLWHQSYSWFRLLDDLGIVARWLASEDDHLVEIGLTLISNAQQHDGDRVAELLSPFVGKSEKWNTYLRNVVQRLRSDATSEYLSLVARLVDEEAFDEDFWLQLDHLSTTASGVCDLISRYLDRELATEKAQGATYEVWGMSRRDRSPDYSSLRQVLKEAPREFVHAILPYILGMAEIYAKPDQVGLRSDSHWNVHYHEDLVGPGDLWPLVNLVAEALALMAEESNVEFEVTANDLKSSDLEVAHLILIRALTKAAPLYSTWTVDYLCGQNDALGVGYWNAPYWAARELIEAIVPTLDASGLLDLERCILNFFPRRESQRGMGEWFGFGQYMLLTVMPVNRLSSVGKTRLSELVRKFGGGSILPPHKPVMTVVQSPISGDAAAKMSDAAWLSAMTKYTNEPDHSTSDGNIVGGSSQLSSVLEERVKAEPERFARLALMMEDDIAPAFFVAILAGISGGEIDNELLASVVERCHHLPEHPCSFAISSLVGQWPRVDIPSSILEIVGWYAINGDGPREDLTSESEELDLLTVGLNSERGHAADAIARALFREPDRAIELDESIRIMVMDPSTAVRAMVAEILLALMNFDRDFAVKLFITLCKDDAVLGARTIDKFLHYGVATHFGELRGVLERAIRTEGHAANLVGARQAAIASLVTSNADDLVDECLDGNQAQRLGVVQVAAANVASSKHKERLSSILIGAFMDSDGEVRQAACDAFNRFEGDALSGHIDLLQEFLKSPAQVEEYTPIFHCLESTTAELPNEAIEVCEKYLDEHGDSVGDIRRSAAIHAKEITTTAIRMHELSKDISIQARALDVIDTLLYVNAFQVNKALEMFER